MSNNTLVIYLKDPKIKSWLQKKAKTNKGKKSISAVVAGLLEEDYKNDTKKNSLMSLFGRGVSLSSSDWSEWEKSMQDVKSSRVSKSDSFYENLLTDK